MVDVFRNGTRKVPRNTDPQIVRVSMEQLDIGGRKSHLPNAEKSDKMSITHVPSTNGKE